jgi:hypothetical protein
VSGQAYAPTAQVIEIKQIILFTSKASTRAEHARTNQNSMPLSECWRAIQHSTLKDT